MVRVYSAEWLDKNNVRVDCKVTEKDRLLYSISCLCIEEDVSEVHCSVFTFSAAISVGHDISMTINRAVLVARHQAEISEFDSQSLF